MAVSDLYRCVTCGAELHIADLQCADCDLHGSFERVTGMDDNQFNELVQSVTEGAELMADIKITKWKGAERLATSDLEDLLALEIEAAELPSPKRQYKFHSSRRWLADFCWPESRLIVEVNGMTHVASRGHTSYAGIHRDYEKANAAQDMGYRYYQFDREMVEDGTAIKAICDYLGRCEG